MKTDLIVVAVLLCYGYVAFGQQIPGPPDFCPKGLYHKDSPSAESETFATCAPWQGLSCCTPQTTRRINSSIYLMLYNFSSELCGPLYQMNASPIVKHVSMNVSQCLVLGYFLTPLPTVRSVPVCGSYCDRWFDACKDDKTCISDWLASYLQALDESMNICPMGSECTTFAERFNNGRDFCNSIWGDAYFYSEDENNCTVMSFDPDMPNPAVIWEWRKCGAGICWSCDLCDGEIIFHDVKNIKFILQCQSL